MSAGVRAQGDRTPQALFGPAKQDWGTGQTGQSMDFLDSLGISTPSDDAVAARIHQQAAADSDYHQDNRLDSIPESEGPEL